MVSKTHKGGTNRERIRDARAGKEDYPRTRVPGKKVRRKGKAATTKGRYQAGGGDGGSYVLDYSHVPVFGGGRSVREMSEEYYAGIVAQNCTLEAQLRGGGGITTPFISKSQQARIRKREQNEKRRVAEGKHAAQVAEEERKAHAKKNPPIYGVDKDNKYFGFGSEAVRSVLFNKRPTDVGFGAVYPTRSPRSQGISTQLAANFGVGPKANDYYLYLQSIGAEFD